VPRKPKQEKQQISIVVNGQPISVIMHPPTGAQKSWYAYWHGLSRTRSTGQRRFEDAVTVVENMLLNRRGRAVLANALLTDAELIEIQRRHFGKKKDAAAQVRSEKSLANCLDAIAAFSEIMGISPVSTATPDDCANFQQVALTLPNNWRRRPVEKRKPVQYFSDKLRQRRQKSGEVEPLDDLPHYSPNNVLRWSRSLQAAFERANRNALKRKCVRGVVPVEKLLVANPWSQFTWIEGSNRPIRQFDGMELVSLLEYFESQWGGVPVAVLAAKVFLWSACRKSEVAGLIWDSFRPVGNECHFEIIGKWGVERWFRLPEALCQELSGIRNGSPFVFAAYTDQLRLFQSGHQNLINGLDAEFNPKRFGNWFYKRIKEWSESNPKGSAFVHVFRKTTLQYALSGEDIARQVAKDAGVSESVLMTNYAKQTDVEARQRSNRTYQRILASLSPEVAVRYGYVQDPRSEMENQLRAAIDAKDWVRASELAAKLLEQEPP
jgi:integrase